MEALMPVAVIATCRGTRQGEPVPVLECIGPVQCTAAVGACGTILVSLKNQDANLFYTRSPVTPINFLPGHQDTMPVSPLFV
jgi:hypothetical protein